MCRLDGVISRIGEHGVNCNMGVAVNCAGLEG